jgi:uncharacterized phiE125 gp8 family phage protein
MYAETKQLTYPDIPAVDVATFADRLKLTSDSEYLSEEALLNALLLTASQFACNYLNRTLITATWLRQFSSDDKYTGSLTRLNRGINKYYLPYSPVNKINSIKLISGEISTEPEEIAITEYLFDNVSEPAVVIIPEIPTGLERIQIEYEAGYGDTPESIPEVIKQGILQHASFMFAFRGDCSAEDSAKQSGAIMIYNSFRVGVI